MIFLIGWRGSLFGGFRQRLPNGGLNPHERDRPLLEPIADDVPVSAIHSTAIRIRSRRLIVPRTRVAGRGGNADGPTVDVRRTGLRFKFMCRNHPIFWDGGHYSFNPASYWIQTGSSTQGRRNVPTSTGNRPGPSLTA